MNSSCNMRYSYILKIHVLLSFDNIIHDIVCILAQPPAASLGQTLNREQWWRQIVKSGVAKKFNSNKTLSALKMLHKL